MARMQPKMMAVVLWRAYSGVVGGCAEADVDAVAGLVVQVEGACQQRGNDPSQHSWTEWNMQIG